MGDPVFVGISPEEAKDAIRELYRERDEVKRELSNALLQVGELQKKVSEQRKMLWWCARDAGLCLHIPKAELESIPDGAELLVWYEKLFDSMALKGICSPTVQGEPVVEKTNPEKRKDQTQVCDSCGWNNGPEGGGGSRVMYTAGKVVTCEHCIPTSR